MQVKSVMLNTLKFSSHNPPERTRKDSLNLKRLVQSLEKVGLQYPILIDKKDEQTVIDGHRRVAAARLLGWDSIPALFTSNDDVERIYAEVNAESRPLGGHENLRVWLKRPNAVADQLRKRLEAHEETFGRQLLIRTADHGYAPTIFCVVILAARYVGHADDTVFLTRCLKWCLKHRNPHYVRAYIRMGNSPKALYRLVMSGKNLTIAAR